MLDTVLREHMFKQVREEIKGKEPAAAKMVVAGEIFMRQRHLEEAQRQEERLNDEIAELRKFDVDVELAEMAKKV